MKGYAKRNRIFLIMWILTAISSSISAQNDTLLNAPVRCFTGEWNLVFSDDFEGNSLDGNKWITWFPYTDDGSDKCTFCRTHGNEGQIFRDENAVVSDGSLKLIARKETGEWMGETRDYSSALIHSRHEFGMGKYEIRCRIPSGMGFWTAFWMFGRKATEIDVFEIGSQKPRYHHVGIHSWNTKTSLQKGYRGRTNLADGYHIYTMIWDSNFVSVAVDGKEVWRVSQFANKRGRVIKKCPIKPGKYRLNQTFPPKGEMLSVIAGMAVGTDNTPFTKSPDEKTVFPNQMEIDWIRIYEKK
jgi:beta-glucanase (GH16 family)